MENWWVNAYFIGCTVTSVWFLLTFSGIVREQYIWERTFWTVPYKDKNDRTAVYSAALVASLFWPVVLITIFVVVMTAFFYWCSYHIFKKLR